MTFKVALTTYGSIIITSLLLCACSAPEERVQDRPPVDSTHLEDQSEKEVSSEATDSGQITMELIWKLRKNLEHKRLIESVDIFLASKQRNFDTIGTCLYLKADAHRMIGEYEQAKRQFQAVIEEYGPAVFKTIDPENESREITISVMTEAEVGMRLASEQDETPFPDSSKDYTRLAWYYLEKQKFDTADFMAKQCIKRWEDKARSQSETHQKNYPSEPPKLDPDPLKNEPILKEYWALYDVGTCTFIEGTILERRGDFEIREGRKEKGMDLYRHAIQKFGTVIKEYPGAQCFDQDGPWYWIVRKAAERQCDIIEGYKMKKD